MQDTYVEKGESGAGRPWADQNAFRCVAESERQRQRGRDCSVRASSTSTDVVGGSVQLSLASKRLLLSVDNRWVGSSEWHWTCRCTQTTITTTRTLSQRSEECKNTRRHCFCASWPWPQNKWVSRNHAGTFLCQVWLS